LGRIWSRLLTKVRCVGGPDGYSEVYGNPVCGEKGYFLTSGGFVTGALCLLKRLASGLRGLQSSGGNETRQKRALGWANPIPISGSSSCPGLMSFTVQTSSSPVATWVIFKTCPTMTGSRRRIRPPGAFTTKVLVRSLNGEPMARVPDTMMGTDRTMRWLRR